MSGSKPLYDYEATRRIDTETIDSGFPEAQLMGQAALASLHALAGRLRDTKRLFLLCGTGNNGGDGLALAYMLLGHDASFRRRIDVYQTGPARTENARFYEGQLRRTGLPLKKAAEFEKATPGPEDLIVEALMGTGQGSSPRENVLSLLRKVSALRRARPGPAYVALDVPAGLSEKGPARFFPPGEGELFAAPDEIHSYGVEKLALRLHRDLSAHSEIRVLPMGFHPDALSQTVRARLATREFDPSFFRKEATGHKYSAGHALLVGGSPGMEGAVVMAANAFFSAGGGILHALVPEEESRRFLCARHPHVMFHSPERPPRPDLRPAAVCAGPGLKPEDLPRMRETLIGLALSGARMVLDAGALPLVRDEGYPEAARGSTLITPHGGEWKRLGGPEIGDVAGLYEALDWNGRELRCHSLFKDCVSALLAPDGSEALVFSDPNPSLAVGGSGDSLAGIVLAAFARKRRGEIALRDLVSASQRLHAAAGKRKFHPTGGDFPELTRAALGET